MTIITLGPIGTFSEEAAKKYYSQDEIILKGSIADVFLELAKDENNKALLPFINTTSGIIEETILGLIKNECYICSKHSLEISYVIAGEASLSSCSKLYAHPHAYMQCKDYLQGFQGEIIHTKSNSHSANFAKQDPLSLCLTSYEAAKKQNLFIAFKDIKDRADNSTYFGKISRILPDKSHKTTLISLGYKCSKEALLYALKGFELYFMVGKSIAICEIPSEIDFDKLLSKTNLDVHCNILGRY
ncbi:MAG: hypothetical protein S4CHLAM37_13940 [Chlamydiia bacterium]|nr:hypothetical protein [Chlamydiia bacterium]